MYRCRKSRSGTQIKKLYEMMVELSKGLEATNAELAKTQGYDTGIQWSEGKD